MCNNFYRKKQKGEDMYAGANCNRTKMCANLSKLLGGK